MKIVVLLIVNGLLTLDISQVIAAEIQAKTPDQAPEKPQPVAASSNAAASEPAQSASLPAGRAAIRTILEQEAKKVGLPPDVAEAVVRIESGYDPTVIGSVGEIGLMQVRPGTAAMLGFHGDVSELAKPDVNIHYGVAYLGQAWRLANGDLCRALMKYRAGHGEEIMSPLSVSYCNRARSNLAALGSPLATFGVSSPVVPAFVMATPKPSMTLISPVAVYRKFKQGTPAASQAFWAAQQARVRMITARIEAKWNRHIASR